MKMFGDAAGGGRITNVNVTADDVQYLDATGNGKLYLMADEDCWLAFDQFAATNGPRITLYGGTQYIYDEPNPFNQVIYLIKKTAGTAAIEMMVTRGVEG